MSWVDSKGKRHPTQEDVEQANLMADLIARRLHALRRDEEVKTTREPPVTGADLVRKHFQKDFERLSTLPRSAIRLFAFLLKNGRSHMLDMQEDSGIPQRTIYSALKKLEDADLVDKNHEDCWFIKAKGFISLT